MNYFDAFQNGEVDVVQELLEKDHATIIETLRQKNENGMTPFTYAIRWEAWSTLRMVFEELGEEAEVLYEDVDENLELGIIVNRTRNEREVLELLKYSRNQLWRLLTMTEEVPIIHSVIERGFSEIARYIIEQFGDQTAQLFKIRDDRGKLPLEFGLRNTESSIVQDVLENFEEFAFQLKPSGYYENDDMFLECGFGDPQLRTTWYFFAYNNFPASDNKFVMSIDKQRTVKGMLSKWCKQEPSDKDKDLLASVLAIRHVLDMNENRDIPEFIAQAGLQELFDSEVDSLKTRYGDYKVEML